MEKKNESYDEDFIEENNDLKKNINEINKLSNEEFEPSKTILESSIQKSIKEIEELNLENKTISSEEFSQIINQFDDDKLISTLINLDDNIEIEYLEKKNIENKYPEEKFEKIYNKFSLDYINKLKNHILSLKVSINQITENQLISPILNINKLIEENYNNEELKNKLNNIKK